MVNLENYEEYMLMAADGELNEVEEKALHSFIEQHPELKDEMALYAAIRLTPDASEVYEGKEILLKTTEKPRVIAFKSWGLYSAAAAACIAMFVFLFTKNPDGEVETPAVANTKTVSKPADSFTAAPVAEKNNKELHSIPVNSIALETKPRQQLKKLKVETIKEEPKALPIVKAELIAPKQDKKPEVLIPEPDQKTPIEQIAQQENPKPEVLEPTPTIESRRTKHENSLLARLPIDEEKLLGLNDLSDAVNSKIEKVKNLKKQLHDTDVSVKIGNKELFVVRF